MSDSRARRAAKPASKAKSSLAQLAELRRTGAKRVHDFELTEEEAVYDEVQEQDYAQLVQDRREQAGDFIVDDDGMGYADIGEEEDWGRSDKKAANVTDGPTTSKRRKDGSTAEQRGSKRKSAEPDPKAKQRMQGMFKRAPARAVQRSSATDQSSEDLLSDILGSIGGDEKPSLPGSSSTGGLTARSHPAGRPKSQPPPTKAAMKKPTYSRARAATNFALMNEAEAPQYDASEAQEDMLEATHQEAAEPAADPMDQDGRDAMPDSDQMVQDAQQEQQQQQPEAMQEDLVKPIARPLLQLQHQQPQQAGVTPTAEDSVQAKPPSKTPWKTPPPLFADPKTPATAAPASGWQDMYDDAADEDASGAEAQVETVWTDDGSLPLDSQGQMPFFLLDAHEETATPGLVYLFGKVVHQGSQLSACAIVKGTQRNLFVVPSSNTLEEEDLKSLQEAADADPSMKGQLMKKLHELTTEMKAEVRSVLQHYGITQFKIRPVRRNYAFEQPGVAHAMQWVLKVTYPAAMPQLPLGLSGAQTSTITACKRCPLC
ncbi:hypothetical protein ABBQ32_013429 [Trebouxia sp. C0010 RCD-2024]